MDDEPQIGLVEPHAEGRGGHDDPDAVGEEIGLDPQTLLRLRAAPVSVCDDAAPREPPGHGLGIFDGQAVHDAGSRKDGDDLREVAQSLLLGRQVFQRQDERCPARACRGK